MEENPQKPAFAVFLGSQLLAEGAWVSNETAKSAAGREISISLGP
jgi:hypothetical protein